MDLKTNTGTNTGDNDDVHDTISDNNIRRRVEQVVRMHKKANEPLKLAYDLDRATIRSCTGWKRRERSIKQMTRDCQRRRSCYRVAGPYIKRLANAAIVK